MIENLQMQSSTISEIFLILLSILHFAYFILQVSYITMIGNTYHIFNFPSLNRKLQKHEEYLTLRSYSNRNWELTAIIELHPALISNLVFRWFQGNDSQIYKRINFLSYHLSNSIIGVIPFDLAIAQILSSSLYHSGFVHCFK